MDDDMGPYDIGLVTMLRVVPLAKWPVELNGLGVERNGAADDAR
jgi:hypothetical protein